MRWSLQSRPHHRSKSNWESYRLFPTAYPRHPCPPSLSGPLPDPVVSSWRAVAPSSSLPPTQNTPGHSHPRPSHPQTAAKKKKLQDSHPLAPPRLQPHPSPPLIIHSYSRALRHPSATIVTSVLLYAALPNRRLSRACLLPPASNLASPFIRLFFCLRLPAKHNSPSGAARRRSIGDLHLIRGRNKPSPRSGNEAEHHERVTYL